MNPILKYLSGDTRRLGVVLETRNDSDAIPEDLDIFFDVPYTGASGNSLHADIYRQKNKSHLPVIIMIHGGGLFLGETRSSRPIAEYYARQGYLTAVISYRLLQEANGIFIISDVLCGYDFVFEHIGEYGGDCSNVFVTGESAGAFLAIMANAVSNSKKLSETLELKPSELKTRAMAFFSGMIYTNRLDFLGLIYRHDLYGDKTKNRAFLKLINPEENEIMNKMPPILMSTSDGDFLKKYSFDYDLALRRNNKMTELVYYPDKDLVHAFPIVSYSREQSREVHRKVIEFFNRNLAWCDDL